MRILLLAACFGAAVAGDAPGKPDAAQTRNPATQVPKPEENLSEKLEKGKGVIKPPSDIDPGIARPAPETPSKTPIIPPQAPGAK